MEEIKKIDIRYAINQGLIAAVIALTVSVIGMVELFAQRDLVSKLLTMGQLLIFVAPIALAYLMARKFHAENRAKAYGFGAVVGITSALPLIILIWMAELYDVRKILINVSPALISVLTFGQEPVLGSIVLLLVMVAVCLVAVLIYYIPDKYTDPFLSALFTTLMIGLFSELLSERTRNFFGTVVEKFVFRSKALQPLAALIIFVVAIGLSYWNHNRKQEEQVKRSLFNYRVNGEIQWVNVIITSLILMILPFILGTYLSEVTNNVGIYILMGLGLNIVVGFAGLLDLGYVAFFAIGAYIMAILTTEGALGLGDWSFWTALPVCVGVAALFGLILGMPVLRMRGDYLAIVTLGFGEIIRILALSDLLKPYIGGAQGVLQIPKPSIGGLYLVKPEYLYYVILAGVLFAAFVSHRLQRSRLGRQWMAMREDEDVAEAVGINLVNTKLLAFSIGAAFSGLSGAIFAAKLTSIFPHSFNLLISINVLCLIIVGGMGSLPGVIVGAAILVGLPELLREFAEFRMLMYGVLLVVMMLAKPEGFIPSEVHKRELHRDEDRGIAETD